MPLLAGWAAASGQGPGTERSLGPIISTTRPAPRRSRSSTVKRRQCDIRASATYSAFVRLHPAERLSDSPRLAPKLLRAARRHRSFEQPLERDVRQARGDLLAPTHLVQDRRRFGPEKRGCGEVLVAEQIETVGRETRLHDRAGVEDDHRSAPFARTTDGANDVRHRLTRGSPAPGRGEAHLGPRDERQQVRFLDQVLRTCAARGEPSRPDPPPDGLRIAAHTASHLRDCKHRSSILQHAPRDIPMHVDRFWSRSNVIARSVSLSADGRSLFAAVDRNRYRPVRWTDQVTGSSINWGPREQPVATAAGASSRRLQYPSKNRVDFGVSRGRP